MDELADWIRHQGGTVHVEFRDESGEGRGAIATRAIEHGARILSVPHALLLTPAVVGESELGRALASSAAGASVVEQQCLLAAYLLLSRRVTTPWTPYALALPACAPDVPVTYSENDLALLQGSSILRRIRRERQLFRWEYDTMIAAVPALSESTFDEYLCARTLVPSRAFAVLGTEALVPMADMFNHRRIPDVEWGYEHPAESFVMRATRDIAAGEQVHDSYGKKSNGLLFEIYGFCIDDPERDEAEVRLPAIDSRHPLAGGTSTFGRVVEGERAFRLASTSRGAEETVAVTYLRRLLGDSTPLDATDPRVRRAMVDACDRALAAFPPAPHLGDASPADSTLDARAKKCLRVCSGERSVLSAVRARYAAAAPVA